MGPITLFDKSFIEMLNIDEAAIFDCLYSSVICPIFYTEVLADLSKEPPGQRSAERIVGDVAKKTPIMHATPNVLHTTICMEELAGNAVEMRHVPLRSGGKPVRRPDGTVGVIYDQAPEARAFDRWQRGQFREIERDFAFGWRKKLLEADGELTAKLTRQILAITQEPKNLKEALAIARQVLQGEGQRFLLLKTAYLLLGLDRRHFHRVQARWVAAGRPPLHEFAPYTAHCLLVEVFFNVAIGKKLISPDRASNRVDMAYLFYLPFSMIFISNDKLHQRAAPLFLTDKQIFVVGDDLKKDLAALNNLYSMLSEEEKSEGLIRIASYPPNDDSWLTTRIWKRLGMRIERQSTARNSESPSATELLAHVKQMQDNSKQSDRAVHFSRSELEDPSHVVIKRMVPLRRGKWRFMPVGVEASDD